MFRVAVRLLLRAGWFPLAVLAAHAVLSLVFHAYKAWPPLDGPMHVLGGIAGAHFLARSFAALPADWIAPRIRPALEAVVVVGMVALAAVTWEFAEWLSDRWLRTRAQGGLTDTLGDLAVGIGGALAYLGVAWARGTLGAVDPLAPRAAVPERLHSSPRHARSGDPGRPPAG
jgi:hypothetical protein